MPDPTSPRFRWGKVLLAVIAAEAVPILILVGIVTVYAMVRSEDSLSPEEFAPLAGNWVGPIGGFLCTMLMACWAARAEHWKLPHGVVVGVGAALLDVGLAVGMAGSAAITLLMIGSIAGRVAAGVIGGVIASRTWR